jgi:hypothetical protein
MQSERLPKQCYNNLELFPSPRAFRAKPKTRYKALGWKEVFDQIDQDKRAGELRLQAALLRDAKVDAHWKDQWEEIVSRISEELPKLNSELRARSILGVNNDLVFHRQRDNFYSISNPAMPCVELFLKCSPSKAITIRGQWRRNASSAVDMSPLKIEFGVDRNFEPCLRLDNEECGATRVVEYLLREIASCFGKTV